MYCFNMFMKERRLKLKNMFAPKQLYYGRSNFCTFCPTKRLKKYTLKSHVPYSMHGFLEHAQERRS